MRIVGASGDSIASHQKFMKKYGIGFPLLADAGNTLREAFGAGSRTTFLIDAQGKIVRVWPKVSVAGHPEEVYSSIS